MKTLLKSDPLVPRSLVIIVAFVLITFSCTKTNDNAPGNNTGNNNAVKYCGSVAWSNTNNQSGTFTGSLVSGQFELESASYRENSNTPGVVNFTYDASGHLLNENGLTVTYNQNTLVKYVIDLSYVSKGTGTSTYSFDANGYLTNISTIGSDGNGPLSESITYTYDNNGDPVHIVGQGSETLATGLALINYDITADYLTDKTSMIPFVQIAAPFSTYFAYGPFMSHHLINKWVIKQDETLAGKPLPEINFTQQYTYTFDSNGRVATMYHSGNPNNIYTFTYSGCN